MVLSNELLRLASSNYFGSAPAVQQPKNANFDWLARRNASEPRREIRVFARQRNTPLTTNASVFTERIVGCALASLGRFMRLRAHPVLFCENLYFGIGGAEGNRTLDLLNAIQKSFVTKT